MNRFRPVAAQLTDAAIVLYSFGVMASVAPSLHAITNILLVPYYLLVPGYVLTALLFKGAGKVGRLFYTVIWGLVLVASVISIEEIAEGSQVLPPGIVIPVLTLTIFVYNHFHRTTPF